MALHVCVSDTYELLQEYLVHFLQESFQFPGALGLEPMTVIVPTLGIARQLRQDLARRFGVDGHVNYDYLAGWTWKEISALNPQFKAVQGLQGEALVWRIDRYLSDEQWLEAMPRLQHYVQRADRIKRWQLASHIALLFQRYHAYRLDWVQAWIQGKDPQTLSEFDSEQGLVEHPDYAWQKALWQRLGSEVDLSGLHPAQVLTQSTLMYGTPVDLHVFKPQNVPPLYLQMLTTISKTREVYLYLKNPCSRYWLDVRSRKNWTAKEIENAQKWHLFEAEGHPLLANWAGQTRAMFQLFQTYMDQMQESSELINQNEAYLNESYEPNSNLTHLQRSVALMDLSQLQCVKPSPEDRSLEFHSCSSLKREVEALQDYLYDLFDRHPDLRADQVLVVTPDIDKLAPMVDAVFAQQSPDKALSYRIQGRSRIHQNPVSEALVQLMQICLTQAAASEVFSFISNDAVNAAFGLNETDLQQIAQWFTQAGFRSGLSAQQMRDQGLETIEGFTLENAINRLMLAFVMPPEYRAVMADLVVSTEVPERQALSVLLCIFRHLKQLQEASLNEKTLAQWNAWLVQAIEALCSDNRFASHRLECLNVIDTMLKNQQNAQAQDQVLPLALYKTIFENNFEQWSAGAVPSAGITFTNMGSLQGLPYRVICVLGLNDGVFPSTARADSFDLMSVFTRKGDRQRVKDDRNTLFDLLMDANEYFYISFTGVSNQDGQMRSASILVDELLDLLTQAQENLQEPKAKQAYRDAWILEHPLHGFTAKSFVPVNNTDTRVLSRNSALREAVHEALKGEYSPIESLWPSTARLADNAINKEISLENFARFWSLPIQWFWSRRLGAAKPEEMQALLDVEPYQCDGASAWQVRSELLQGKLSGQEDRSASAYFQSSPQLPIRPLSDVLIENAQATVNELYQALLSRTNGQSAQQVPVELALNVNGKKWVISGEVASVYPQGMIVCVTSKLRGKYVMRAWIQWLALSAAGHSMPLVILAEQADSTWQENSKERPYAMQFKAMQPRCAQAVLTRLLHYYQEGSQEPLWFDPSVFFCHYLHEKKQDSAAQQCVESIQAYQPYLCALAPERGLTQAWFETILEHSERVAQAVLAATNEQGQEQ